MDLTGVVGRITDHRLPGVATKAFLAGAVLLDASTTSSFQPTPV